MVHPTEETQVGMMERECWGTSAEGRSQEAFPAAKETLGQLVGSTCLQTPPGREVGRGGPGAGACLVCLVCSEQHGFSGGQGVTAGPRGHLGTL